MEECRERDGAVEEGEKERRVGVSGDGCPDGRDVSEVRRICIPSIL